jgi:glucose/arabinose dehydrogenase
VSRVSRRTGERASPLIVALLSAALLTACTGGGYESAGPFRPKPEGAPPEVGPPSATAPAPIPGEPAKPGSGQNAGDPNVVASGLTVPTGLVLLPDGSAVVGERDSGRLWHVFPDRSPKQQLMTVAGVDAAGDGGLLGLALSPTFDQDGLLYAYLSTATDNRVVRFPLSGGTPNPVLTGIPRGEVHNGGGLLFGADGTLYVGTGDTGNPELSEDPASLAGKVLRIDVFGRPVGGRPYFTRGHRDVTALCPAGEDQLFATDDALDGPDELDVLVDGGDFGAPPRGLPPVAEIAPDEGGLAGCAAAGGTVFLGALDGERVHVLFLDGSGTVTGDPQELLGGQYGRLRSTALDADGGLWLTTSNKDGKGTPDEDDDKVLRVLPPAAQSDSPL